MTAIRRVSDYITATTTPAQAWGSPTPSYPVGSVKGGVVALDRDGPMTDERVAWRALVGELETRVAELEERDAERVARIAEVEAELREACRCIQGMMALGRMTLDCSAPALHRLDDDEEGLEQTIIDLPRLEAQRLFPGPGGGFRG